jgi:CubicO group peptidase (beta-lactamase class C family)
MPHIAGSVAPGFEPVRDAFVRNFEKDGEDGAAVCVHVNGRPVVDLWGGTYGDDTLELVFSTTKGATALCAHVLAQRGLLDLDAPVVEYWPEFGAEGKQAIPVRWLLCHKAGLPVIDTPLTLEQTLAWDPVVDALARQRPVWPPGTAHGYHATTFGWLVGEVVRRITGRSLGTFFAEEVAAPLGLEFWIGLPESLHPRVSRLIPPFELGSAVVAGGARAAAAGGQPAPSGQTGSNADLAKLIDEFLGPDSLTMRALNTPSSVLADAPDGYNTPAIWSAEIPAVNGITKARSLSRMYASMVSEVDGVRLLSPESVDEARRCQADGPDKVIVFPMRWGSGYMLASSTIGLLGPGSFGHAGFGGSIGFADPESGVGFGYVMNKLQFGVAGDRRSFRLIRAVKQCLEAS